MSTASTVYAYSNMLEKPCIDAAPMLDKKSRCLQNWFSAHPVLWICSRFSTAEPDSGRFDVLHFPFCHPGDAFGGLLRLPVPLPAFFHACSHVAPAWMRTSRHVLPVDKTTLMQCWRMHLDEMPASRVQRGVCFCRQGCGQDQMLCFFFCRQMKAEQCLRLSSDELFAGSDLRGWPVRRRACGQRQGTSFFADKTALASCRSCRQLQRVRCHANAALFRQKFLLFS